MVKCSTVKSQEPKQLCFSKPQCSCYSLSKVFGLSCRVILSGYFVGLFIKAYIFTEFKKGYCADYRTLSERIKVKVKVLLSLLSAFSYEMFHTSVKFG